MRRIIMALTLASLVAFVSKSTLPVLRRMGFVEH